MAHGPDTEELLRRISTIQENNLGLVGLNITSLPELPNGIHILCCNNTQITELPPLPSTLQKLFCYGTQITELPPLPSTLQELYCADTQITELPPLPSTLQKLFCYGTQITELPPLPSTLQGLYCHNCSNLKLQRNKNETNQEYKERWKLFHEERVSKARIQERCATIKEELMAAAWHPNRVERWIETCGIEVLDE
jgi:Leucine-rich repeat (LRR) protein